MPSLRSPSTRRRPRRASRRGPAFPATIARRSDGRIFSVRSGSRDGGGNCQVLVWVRNHCAAVVDTSTRFVAGIGSTRSRAVHDARRRAHDSFARRVAWVCSGY
jgi:hypothetical protein